MPRRELGSGKLGSKSLKRMDRSLVFFVMALQGHDIIVELRNNTFLRGTLYVADIYMKCDHMYCVILMPWMHCMALHACN